MRSLHVFMLSVLNLLIFAFLMLSVLQLVFVHSFTLSFLHPLIPSPLHPFTPSTFTYSLHPFTPFSRHPFSLSRFHPLIPSPLILSLLHFGCITCTQVRDAGTVDTIHAIEFYAMSLRDLCRYGFTRTHALLISTCTHTRTNISSLTGH